MTQAFLSLTLIHVHMDPVSDFLRDYRLCSDRWFFGKQKTYLLHTRMYIYIKNCVGRLCARGEENWMWRTLIVNEPRTCKQCNVSTVTSTIFRKLDDSTHGHVIECEAHERTRHDQIILFGVHENSGCGISDQPRWRSDWRFLAPGNKATAQILFKMMSKVFPAVHWF